MVASRSTAASNCAASMPGIVRGAPGAAFLARFCHSTEVYTGPCQEFQIGWVDMPRQPYLRAMRRHVSLARTFTLCLCVAALLLLLARAPRFTPSYAPTSWIRPVPPMQALLAAERFSKTPQETAAHTSRGIARRTQ